MLDAGMLVPAISWPGGSPENTAIIVGVVVGAYLGALWLAALIWTVRDIRERSEDPFTQVVAFSIVFVFNLPGWVLYLVLRPPLTLADVYERQLEEEALRQELDDRLACPSCDREVQEEYVACPLCGTTLKTPCRACERPVSFSWVACPWCGARREPTPAIAAVGREQIAARERAPESAEPLRARRAATAAGTGAAQGSTPIQREVRPIRRTGGPAPSPDAGGGERPHPFRRRRGEGPEPAPAAAPN